LTEFKKILKIFYEFIPQKIRVKWYNIEESEIKKNIRQEKSEEN